MTDQSSVPELARLARSVSLFCRCDDSTGHFHAEDLEALLDKAYRLGENAGLDRLAERCEADGFTETAGAIRVYKSLKVERAGR